MYGPLDVVALSGEDVRLDVWTGQDGSSGGEWRNLGTAVTDGNGRMAFAIGDESRLPLGIHPIRMTVVGDLSSWLTYLAVVPPKTECVLFSIDGSFTASVSVSGAHPFPFLPAMAALLTLFSNLVSKQQTM